LGHAQEGVGWRFVNNSNPHLGNVGVGADWRAGRAGWLADWLVGWLADWLAGWRGVWVAGWLAGRLNGWHGWLVGWVVGSSRFTHSSRTSIVVGWLERINVSCREGQLELEI